MTNVIEMVDERSALVDTILDVVYNSELQVADVIGCLELAKFHLIMGEVFNKGEN